MVQCSAMQLRYILQVTISSSGVPHSFHSWNPFQANDLSSNFLRVHHGWYGQLQLLPLKLPISLARVTCPAHSAWLNNIEDTNYEVISYILLLLLPLYQNIFFNIMFSNTFHSCVKRVILGVVPYTLSCWHLRRPYLYNTLYRPKYIGYFKTYRPYFGRWFGS